MGMYRLSRFPNRSCAIHFRETKYTQLTTHLVGAFADPRTKRHGLSLIRSIGACHLTRRLRVADVIFIAKTRRCKTFRLWPSCHESVMKRTKRYGFCGSSVQNVTAFADLWTACMDENAPPFVRPRTPLASSE